MGVTFNDNGVLRNIEEIPVNVAGKMHDVHLVQHNDGGTLKTVWLNPNAIHRVEISVDRYSFANYFGNTSYPPNNATTTVGSNNVSFFPNYSGSVVRLYFNFFDKYGNSAPMGLALLSSLSLRCNFNVYKDADENTGISAFAWFQSPFQEFDVTGTMPINRNGTQYWERGYSGNDAVTFGCISFDTDYSTMKFTINSLDLVDNLAPTVSLKSIPFTILPFVDKAF